MTVLLKDTIKPNLVQTLEGQPAFVHCGPFANIAHGNNSLVADRVALKLGDYVVTESGFGADMGMEKFFDIVCRVGAAAAERGRAGGDGQGAQAPRRQPAGRPGRDRGRCGQPRPTPRHHPRVRAQRGRGGQPVPDGHARTRSTWSSGSRSRRGAYAAEVNEGFERGGEGAAALAEAVVAAADEPNSFDYLYPLDAPIEEKIEAIATRVYGADGVFLLKPAQEKVAQFDAAGLGNLPICMAKTHLSLSHDATLTNAPTGFMVTVRDIRAYTGAGWLVALCGDMQTMPGLGKTPAAHNVDIDESGRTVGLF